MKKELKEKWLEELRSGRYAQGRKALRSADDKFCCLGVLADIVAPEEWEQRVPDSCYYSHWARSGSSLWMVKEEIDLYSPATSTLITMNDTGSSFEEIADWIEENL